MTAPLGPAPEPGWVTCDECGQRHTASYSHEGRFNEGPIFEVVCVDGLSDFYTAERVNPFPAKTGAS